VIKKDMINYVADLARISLAGDEEKLFASQLNDILAYIEKLNKLDTAGVEPMSHAVILVNMFRDDKVKDSLPKDEALRNAPEKEKDFFKVPKVIE